MNFFTRKEKKYYCCKCLEETVVLHRDWYGICSMYGHRNSKYRPIFEWKNNKFDYKNFIKEKKKIINDLQKGKIHLGCIDCKDLEKKEWKGKCNKLYHLHFRLSKKCNAKCIYCNDKTDNISPDRPFFNDLRTLIKKGVIDKNALMEFGGGEFTLHDEFDKIFRYLLDNGFHRYKIYTSCLRHSPELEEALGHGKTELIISADAGDKETFIKIKRADTYDRFWNNLTKYVSAQNENKYQVKLKYLICKGLNDSKEQINAFLKKANEIGIRTVIFDIEYKDVNYFQSVQDKNQMEYLHDLIEYAKLQAESTYGFKFEKFAYIELIEKLYPELWGNPI